MNIAVVGGGTRCRQLINIIKRHTFHEIDPKVIAVAEKNKDAPGLIQAKKDGLFTTNNYNRFFERDDIDLIIELTGDMAIYNDILKKKAPFVRAISKKTAQLFWEISYLSFQQKKTDQKLHEAKAMYQTVINELIQEDVLVIAFDYKIVDINETLLKRLGLKREEVIGKPCYEITHRRDSPCSGKEHPCPLIQTINTQKPSQTTHVHHSKDHLEIFYSISTYPLIENDDIIGVIEISRDITKDLMAQKVMMQQEKLASIGRLSAGVAHEINNPLTTILTTTMLLQEDLNPEHAMYPELQTVVNETLRCRRIVTGLLDFARQKKPKKQFHKINDIVTESLLLINKQAAFDDVRLKQYLAEEIPDVYIDRGQLQQALINLAMNAVEVTEPGGKVAFATRYLPEQNLAEMTVSDNGPGISPDTLDKIIDPFFTTKENGNGLGLAITHGIVEQHGGTLDVMSELGKGSCFVIRLPVKKGGGHGK